MNEIRFWNRAKGREDVERIYGESFMRWVYETPRGRKLSEMVLSHRALSFIYGIYQSSQLSKRKVDAFIQEFRIPMDEYDPGPFDSFNDFFIRRFLPGKRDFPHEKDVMGAFAEGRYLAFDRVDEQTLFPVKGTRLTAEGLLGDLESTRPFIGGPMLIARLCPTDYHRFHFPDAGTLFSHYTLHGRLHSVSPLALGYRGDILITNERQVSLLKTVNFGTLAYVEVGALCVGRIEQTYQAEKPFRRGEEKGYFLFGGSTVIVMGEPGKWCPDEDLLAETRRSRETLVRLGEPVARSKPG